VNRLCYRLPDSNMSIHFLKAPDIPRLLRLGLLDFGVAPDEWVEEWSLADDRRYPFTTETLAKIQVLNVRISLITSGRNVAAQTDRIVTPFPFIARRHIVPRYPGAELIEVRGSSEGLVLGIGTAAVDCVETGGTLRANDLVESEVILTGLGASLLRSNGGKSGGRNRKEEQLILDAVPTGANGDLLVKLPTADDRIRADWSCWPVGSLHHCERSCAAL
jgi:ATP phosphoribosyltransferase